MKPDFYTPKAKPDLNSGKFKKLSDLNAMPHPAANAPAAAASNTNFSPGMRVRHGKFGEGVILSTEGEGANGKLKIRFDTPGIGIKTLLTQFAKLEKC